MSATCLSQEGWAVRVGTATQRTSMQPCNESLEAHAGVERESESESHSVMSGSLRPHGLPMGLSRPEYWSG